MIGLIDSLENTIHKADVEAQAAPNGATITTPPIIRDEAFDAKGGHGRRIIGSKSAPATRLGPGRQHRRFQPAGQRDSGIQTVAIDIDPAAVEKNYLTMRAGRRKDLLPLVLDLTNPSPAIGWDNQERRSLHRARPGGLVMALALIHHLAISNNVPAARCWRNSLPDWRRWLIIEFVPKRIPRCSDCWPPARISSRITRPEGFEAAFSHAFHHSAPRVSQGSERTLYLMERR